MLGSDLPQLYSILNDPDTGIHPPDRRAQRVGRSHATLGLIRTQLEQRAVGCVVTFDQSHKREKGLPAETQRSAKLRFLEGKGVPAFYYASHAPFLFAFPSRDYMEKAVNLLTGVGIPEDRLQY